METIGDLVQEGVGYLEMRDYNRARWAWEQSHPAHPFMLWLRDAGHVNFSPEDVRVNSSMTPQIPIPATRLAWEEITRIATELDRQWGDVEKAAGDKFGASLLLDLGREVSTAAHRWPMEDKTRKVVDILCRDCGEMTLIYRPPRFEGDEQIIDCPCGYVMSQEEREQFAEDIKKEANERKKQAMADARRSRRKSA